MQQKKLSSNRNFFFNKTQTKTSFNANSRINEENIKDEEEGEKHPFRFIEIVIGMQCFQPNHKFTLDVP